MNGTEDTEANPGQGQDGQANRWKAAIAGASGYVGGELLRLLAVHPSLEVGTLMADTSAGTLVHQHHGHLPQFANNAIEQLSVENIAQHEIVFLALPHGESAAIAQQLNNARANTVVVDCSADFRLENSQDWATYYGGDKADHAGTWAYGLPELAGAREQLKEATRIAVPGCYPTASTIATAPMIAADLVDPQIVIVAASGTSGAGRAAKRELLGSEVMGAMSVYGAGGTHRHTPEIRQNLARVTDEDVVVSFTPMLAPMSRGIVATCSAPARKRITNDELRQVYEKAYKNEPFVVLLPDGQWPTTASVLGSNMVHVQVAVDEHANRVLAVAAIDNLTKGTAGSAIQSLNIALGIHETTGLPRTGVAP